MKASVFKTGILTVFIFSFLLTSCSKDDTSTENDTSIDLNLEQSKQAAESDEVATGAFDIIETAYIEQEENEGRATSLFSDCVTITISSENEVTFVTMDFGLGCELNNGNIVSGMIHLTYGPVQNGTVNITYNFEDFTFNNHGIEGGGTIFRERYNASGNPQSTFHKNIVITLTNGVTVDIDGTRVREWVEGVGSGTWMDNVFMVTGNWSHEASTGFSRTAIVTNALRREAICPFFVSGTMDVTRNDHAGILDFGDGTCDNIAVLTVNGVEYIIILHH